MRRCPNCGSDVKQGNFCTVCGSELPPEEETNNIAHTQSMDSGKGYQSNQNINTEFNNQSANQNTRTPIRNYGNGYNQVTKHKNAAIAVILSLFIVGLGHVYLGLGKKGLKIFVIQIIFGILTLIFIGYILAFIWAIYAIVDAYECTKAINEGTYVEESLDFRNLIWWN